MTSLLITKVSVLLFCASFSAYIVQVPNLFTSICAVPFSLTLVILVSSQVAVTVAPSATVTTIRGTTPFLIKETFATKEFNVSEVDASTPKEDKLFANASL